LGAIQVKSKSRGGVYSGGDDDDLSCVDLLRRGGEVGDCEEVNDVAAVGMGEDLAPHHRRTPLLR
jgi:hypothetical protein